MQSASYHKTRETKLTELSSMPTADLLAFARTCTRRTRLKLLALGAIMALHGCATIVGDTDVPVTVASEPAGASFEVRDHTGRMIHKGMTPATVNLKTGAGYFQRAEYSVLVHKDGYNDQTVPLRGSISGWYWGNILFGGLIGMLAVDPSTGAMYKLPEATNATLTPMAPVAQK